MKNVKLLKHKKGWLLTIAGYCTVAVTSLELWTIAKVIKDNEAKIMKEINE